VLVFCHLLFLFLSFFLFSFLCFAPWFFSCLGFGISCGLIFHRFPHCFFFLFDMSTRLDTGPAFGPVLFQQYSLACPIFFFLKGEYVRRSCDRHPTDSPILGVQRARSHPSLHLGLLGRPRRPPRSAHSRPFEAQDPSPALVSKPSPLLFLVPDSADRPLHHVAQSLY